VTVSPGASFWTLAQEVASARLGHPASNGEIAAVWNALIAANAAHLVVPGDANLIYPGQVFTVPPP
jgi:nucleoid-associated protein YgaU